MHFLVTAYDGKDSEAPARRANARPTHFEQVKKLKDEGKFLYGGAILDEGGNMIGSMMVMNFPSREALENEWLCDEPYATLGVWKEVEVQPFKVADAFL